ncbi:hypothetical protein DVH05_013262 [Phytophthora capsici]|nr:hypothetical protein DVH05_013262 [Phytophthora capsici]
MVADTLLEELAKDEELGGTERDSSPTVSNSNRNGEGSDAETHPETGVTATGEQRSPETAKEAPRIAGTTTVPDPISTNNRRVSVDKKQQTTNNSRTEVEESPTRTATETLLLPNARTRNRKASQITRKTAEGDGLTNESNKRYNETDARTARAARRNALRDQSTTAATEKVGPTPDNGISGSTTTEVGGKERGDSTEGRATTTRGGDDRHHTVGASTGGEPGDNTREVTDGTARALRGHGQSRWPSAAKTIMAEATTGTVRECGQRKVRNKAGRYETEHRVEYQERPGGPIVPAWITAQEFEQLLDEGKIGDDLLAGDGVWTR